MIEKTALNVDHLPPGRKKVCGRRRCPASDPCETRALARCERRLRVDSNGSIMAVRMAEIGVRREKAALSSGCEAHPAIRSSRKRSEQAWR